ncbi:tetratricopeptide repeat protein [Stenomitos frigidus]|nr:tetratricopeptide repeat protein [Stenomitos frigidus]
MTDSAVFISSSSRDRVDHDVFISYSRRDSEFARHLLTRLKGENRDAWVDWQAIEAAEDFWQAIEVGIEAANTFVFILSPDSVTSKYCNQEIDHAIKHNKRLIPVVCRDVDVTAIHTALRPLNWIFLRETDDDAAFAQLVRAIDTDLPYVRMHTRLQVKAIEWNKRGRDDSFLLRKRDLSDAETWFGGSTGKEPTPTALQHEYITTSRTAEDEYNQLLTRGEQARQRVKWAAIVVPVAVAIASVAGIFAFVETQKANVAVQTATFAEKRAIDAEKRIALANQRAIDADQNANRADQNAKNAETKRKGADQQRKLAEAKLTSAETRQVDAERKATQAEQAQQRAQVTLKNQETKLIAINTDLQQKKQSLRDVWRFSDAWVESLQGRNESALKILNTLLQRNPRNTFVLVGQGFVYGRQMRDYRNAEAVLRQATRIDPEDPIAWLFLGSTLSDQKKLDEAIESFQKSIKLDSSNVQAYNNLGYALYQHNKLDAGIKAWQQAIKLDAQNAMAYYGIGNALYQQNKLDAAIAAFNKAIALDPKFAGAYNNLGNALKDQNKLDEAVEKYQQAIKLNSTMAAPYVGRGEAYFKLQRYTEALADLNRAIDELGYKKERVLKLREQVRREMK